MQAIVHPPSPAMQACELTFVDRTEIDVVLANQQHSGYCELLRDCGVKLKRVTENLAMPDCAFVEDTAIVLPEVAVTTSMGAASRREESAAISRELARHRPLANIELPATIDGGDVLQVGRMLLVGRSQRTNSQGISALQRIVEPWGWNVLPVPVHGCLHLKTACTAINDDQLLVQSSWIDVRPLAGFQCLEVPKDEPWAANLLRLGDVLCLPSAHQHTAELLSQKGHPVRTADISELAKAEAGMTCLCLLF